MNNLNRGMGQIMRVLSVLLLLVVLTACSKGEKALRSGQEMRAVTTPEIKANTVITQFWQSSISGSDIDQPISFVPGFTSNAVFVANSRGEVARFNIEDGETDWRIKLDIELSAGVGIDKAIVAIASSDGEIIAINAADGAEVWRQFVGVAVSAPPLVGQGRVIVRSLDGQVIALNAITGDNIWAYQRPISSLSMAGDALPLLAGEGLITGFSNGRIVASNIFSGQVFWEKRQFRPSGNNLVERLIDIDAQATLVGQFILVGAYQGGIAALRLRDGQEVWRSPTSTRLKISFNEAGAYVTADDGSVHQLDLDTGKPKWAQAALRGHGVSNPVVMNGSVYVGDLDGQLYSLSVDDGHLNGRTSVVSGVVASLHQLDGVVYAYSVQSGQISALK